MNKFLNRVFLISFLLAAQVHGQTVPVLTVELDNIDSVPVGGGFSVSGRILHDANSSAITAGTPVLLDLFINDPSGNRVRRNPTITFFTGFSGGGVQTFSQTFTMPWTEDDKWVNQQTNWTAHAQVTGGGNPSTSDTFGLNLPDLQGSIDPRTPSSVQLGSYITLRGRLSNVGVASSEPQKFFRITASIGTHSESIVFPDANNFPATTSWPIVGNAQDLNFTFQEFLIPQNLSATENVINITVDSTNIIPETNDGNNRFTHPVDFASGVAANLEAFVIVDSERVYQGLDPLKLKLIVRNIESLPIAATDRFAFSIALSKDDILDDSDFVLREIDFGGGANALGAGLLPNESITIDWIQMLPDNFEGDYYILVSNNSAVNTPNQYPYKSKSPEISIRSQNSNELRLVSEKDPSKFLFQNSGRSSTNLNGNLVAFEAFFNDVKQIFVKNLNDGNVLQVSKPSSVLESTPNGSSLAPVISPDGRFVVFHSTASNLVPGDLNGHSDIFLYDLSSFNSVASGLASEDELSTAKISKISNSYTGTGANGPSFYPSISKNGDFIAFESEATNLDVNGTSNGTRQIYLFKHTLGAGIGSISQITNGNKSSFGASVDGNAEKIVFTTHATNIPLTSFTSDTNKFSDVVLWTNGKFYLAGRTQMGIFPEGGASKGAVISLDSSTIAFESNASNMVTGKGISDIFITDGGLNYTSRTTVQINDTNGTGALASVVVNSYGEITDFIINTPGYGYINPTLTVIPHPADPTPTRICTAKPMLVNRDGDVFRIDVNSILNGSNNSIYGSRRVSESQLINGKNGSETGGDGGSREPTIDMNGTRIAYSTLASNLLLNNIVSSSQKTFPNNTFRPPLARAVLQGGIGKITIANPGSGYPASGTFLIQDLSGNGSGAVATYEVDSNGAIGTVNIANTGSGYDLEKTIIQPQNPGTGSGFQVAEILFPPIVGSGINRTGGASVHRIEMTDEGIGYSQQLSSAIQEPSIIVDGDGVDLDLDGKTDAKINPDLIWFGPNGELYLEQRFVVTVENPASLLSTNLTVSDYKKSVSLSFATVDSPPFIIGIRNNNGISRTPTEIRREIITSIAKQWAKPTQIFEGPQIDDNASGGTSFTLRGLSSSVESNNISALRVRQLSNMLIQGSAFTRATPQIAPIPAIHGYSELTEGIVSSSVISGRNTLQFQKDESTDDIYLYDHSIGQNERVSVSKFGFPVNYRPNLLNPTMPSNRFPSISGNGRFIYFSSDADGQGGIDFGNSNQLPRTQTNDGRDIFVRDMKSNSLPEENGNGTVSIDLGIFEQINFKIPVGQEMPVTFNTKLDYGHIKTAYLYVDNQLFDQTGTDGPKKELTDYFRFKSNRVGYETFQIKIEDNFGNIIYSKKVLLEIIEPNPEVIKGELKINPEVKEEDIFIIQRTKFWHVLADTRTRIVVSALSNQDANESNVTTNQVGNANVASDYLYALTNEEPDPIIGPFTSDDIALLKAAQDPQASGFNDAFYASDSALNHKPLSYIYPPRMRITTGSVLNASVNFTSSTGKASDLSHVNFYLNGQYIGKDSAPPYDFNFSPPSFDKDGKYRSTWVLTAQAIPLIGSSYMVQQFGVIDKTVRFPTAILKLDDETELQDDGTVYDNQEVALEVRVSGNSDILEQVNKGYFVANGVSIGVIDGVASTLSSGEVTEVNFQIKFNADFSRYAEANGSIVIYFYGSLDTIESHTPVYRSEPISLSITVPMPWVDDKSSALQLFSDFDDTNITKEQLDLFESIKNTSSNPLSDWTQFLIERQEFQYRIDLIAAQKISLGDWHLDYQNYKTDYDSFKDVMNTNPLWLKGFINSLLTSPEYTRKFGTVPYLVGSASSGRLNSFGLSRRTFVQSCFMNKYGEMPSYLQMNQGSTKILNFWASTETNYWELSRNPDFDVALDSPPRRDTIPPNNYGAGECAVEFIYNFAKEEKFNGFPYIAYTEDYRESLFKKIAVLISLWKKEAFPIDENLIATIKGKPFSEVIDNALNDYRYTSQFNLIWSESDLVANTPDWKKESWFGYFMDKYFPWVFHEDLGWIYIAGVSPMEFWFYSEKLGWVWTRSSSYPALYSSREQGWVYFYKKGSKIIKSDGSETTFAQDYIYIYNSKKWIPINFN